MGTSVSDPWSTADAAVSGRAAAMLADFRAACRPANLALAGILGLGWVALVGWTGAGPEGWQARSCAGLTVQPAACQGVPPAKDTSRIVPHAATASLLPSSAR